MNNNRTTSNGEVSARSATTISLTKKDCTTEEQQVQFIDADAGYTYKVESQPDSTFNLSGTPSIGLGDWLARPQLIKNITWAMGTAPHESFDPWALFFGNPAVAKKLANYPLLRCKLMIKIVVNAAPSFYGQALVSYRPFPKFGATCYDGTDAYGYVQRSQMPHIWVRPQQSQGGCICAPFLYHKNWVDTSLLSNFTDMGEMSFNEVVELRNTSGATTQNIDVSIFAWAIDVEVAQTSTALVAQAGDEYSGSGPVSSIASAVAKTAKVLSQYTLIRPYMRATEIGASAISSIASIFGFTRTPVITPPQLVRNQPFGYMANCGTSENVDRLVIDPKQGLNLDSRTVGLDGTDELSIVGIAVRESYLTQFPWDISTVEGTVLFQTTVTPSQIRYNSGVDNYVPTPMAFAVQPFRYWTGDMLYRFQIVCSQYHRGRLLFQWDPANTISAGVDDINTLASQIVDLSVTRDFEIRVPYGSSYPFLKVDRTYTEQFALGTIGSFTKNTHNGVLSVKVLSELTSLGATGDISIIVSVSAAENLRVGGPTNFNVTHHNVHSVPVAQDPLLVAQAGEEPDTREDGEGAPESLETHTIGATVEEPVDGIASTFFGEVIVSFRTLLKRYHFSRGKEFPLGSNPANDYHKFVARMSRFPVPSGLSANGIDSAGTRNFTRPTLFNYIQGAFVGMRGGMRWKFNYLCDIFPQVEVTRLQGTRTLSTLMETKDGAIFSGAKFYLAEENFAGYTLTNQNTQTGVEVELPHYSQYRMYDANPENNAYGVDYDGSAQDTMKVTAYPKIKSTLDGFDIILTQHCAVADDFNFFFFLCAPIVYVYPEA